MNMNAPPGGETYMDTVRRIALTLVIIGAINWGLIGFFQFDLIAAIFGGQDAGFSRIIYGLVGLSGLFCIGMLFSPLTEDMRGSVDNRNVHYGTEFGEETTIVKHPDHPDNRK